MLVGLQRRAHAIPHEECPLNRKTRLAVRL